MNKLNMLFPLLILMFSAFPAFSYMGPGAGLTAFGCLVALLAGIWYTCKGFLWLPLKRKFSKKVPAETLEQTPPATESADKQS